MKTILSGVVCATFAFSAVAQEVPAREETVQELARAISKGAENEKSFQAYGFDIYVGRMRELDHNLKPSDNVMDMLIVKSDSTFQVSVEKGRKGMSLGGGLALFQRITGQPILSVGDSDGDGRLDGLTYSVIDEKGELVMDVTDYEVDGQADFRVHYKDHYTEIWYLDRWRRVEIRDDVKGMVVDGKFVVLRKENNRWIVP